MTARSGADSPRPVQVRDLGPMDPIYLAVCRDCLTDRDPDCWKCQGDVIYGADAETADLVMRFTVITDPLGICSTTEQTPRLLRWLEDVTG